MQTASGWSDAWFGDADDGVRRVAGDANGLLLQQLLKASGYVDAAFPNNLREGADIIGDLQCSGIGEPIAGNEFKSADMLWRGREASNQALIEGMIFVVALMLAVRCVRGRFAGG